MFKIQSFSSEEFIYYLVSVLCAYVRLADQDSNPCLLMVWLAAHYPAREQGDFELRRFGNICVWLICTYFNTITTEIIQHIYILFFFKLIT